MKTIRRLIYKEILRAVAFVAVAFLLLFVFFDLVEQLQDIGGAGGYTLGQALLYVGLRVPNHLYQLLPIAVLIGSIYVMARLAESSEYTILRTSGLGPGRALGMLLALGAGFAALTFTIGDYVAPEANRAAQLLRSRLAGQLTVGATGGWLKDRDARGHSYSVNVAALSSQGLMRGVRIFEFDEQGRWHATTQAPEARFTREGWLLSQAQRRALQNPADAAQTAPIDTAAAESESAAEATPARIALQQEETLLWPTRLSADMVAAALISPDRMRALGLFQYIRHLQANGQSAQRYEIELWRKVFYPLGCLVMMVLALPFAYLHFRSGNISGYMFIGVMAGISFFLLNNVFGFIGNLRNWQPWIAAATPGLIYSLLSLGAFGWLVLRQ